MRSSGIKIDLDSTSKLFTEKSAEILEVLRFAVRETLKAHAAAGHQVAIWRDGKAVLVNAAAEIRDEEE